MSYTSEVLADSPSVYWRCGESSGNLADSGSVGIAGVVSGTTVTRAVTGLVGDADKAIGLSGGKVEGTPSSSLTGAHTIEIVIQPSGFTGIKIAGSRNTEYGFDISLTATSITAVIGNGTSFITTSASATASFSTGVTYHLALVVTTTGWEWFRNGSSIGSGSFSSATPLVYDTSHHIILGDNGRAEGYVPGVYDEFAIYPTALSSSRIAAHYAAMSNDMLITIPAATATAAMVAPAVSISTGDLTISVPAATATAAMLPPSLRLTSYFTAYTLDDNASQALNIGIELSASLEVDAVPTAEPPGYAAATVRARRLSLVLPTPTLDSRGRPT